MNRRQVLTTLGVGIGGSSGCLRLTGGGGDEPAPTVTDAESDATQTRTKRSDPDAPVTLTESWRGDPGIDFAWSKNGRIFFNDYNKAAAASHGGGINWTSEVTYEGFENNFGVDAFAADESRVTFGYTPDPEVNEMIGAHFHTFDRLTGEEVWRFAAPADGKHNFAHGATSVADTVVVATCSFEAEQEPLVVGLAPETGEVRWRTDKSTLPTAWVNYVGSYADEVYVGMASGGVQVLDPETGSLTEVHESWSVARALGTAWGQIHGDTLFAADRASEDESALRAYPLGNQGREWSATFESSVTFGPVVDNSLVTVGTDAGTVYVFNRSTGERLWDVSIDGTVGSIDTSATHVWVGDGETGLTAYTRSDGTRVHRSTKPLGGDDIAVTDGVLILGGDETYAYRIE